MFERGPFDYFVYGYLGKDGVLAFVHHNIPNSLNGIILSYKSKGGEVHWRRMDDYKEAA